MGTYSKYSNDDLIQAYNTMLDYSGKPNKDMLFEIDQRGGLEEFVKTVEFKTKNQTEVGRVRKEVEASLKRGENIDQIKANVKSDILKSEELNFIIDEKFSLYTFHKADTAVTSKTLMGSFIGILIGSFVAGIFLILTLYLFQGFAFFSLIGAYIISYVVIIYFTKQSRRNPVVFVACLIATIFASIIAYLYLKLIL